MKPSLVFAAGVVAGACVAVVVISLWHLPEGLASTAVAKGQVTAARSNHDELPSESRGVVSKEAELGRVPLQQAIERLARWIQNPKSDIGSRSVHDILREWSKEDPHGALEFVMNAPRFPDRLGAAAIPLAEICRADPNFVIGWIRAESVSRDQRTRLASEILGIAMEASPTNALIFALAPEVPVDATTFGTLLGRIAIDDFTKATENLQHVPSEERSDALTAMMRTFAQKEPGRALEWFRTSPEKREELVAPLVEACLASKRFTPEQLLERLQLGPEEYGLAVQAIAGEGMLTDPRMLKGVSDEVRTSAISAMVWRNFEERPDELLHMINTAVPASERLELIKDGWGEWVGTDRKAALAWAKALPDHEMSEALLRADRIAMIQEEEPEKAVALLSTIADPAEQRQAAQPVLMRLAQEKPRAAAEWILGSGAGIADEYVVGRVIVNYLEQDDTAAMDWITRLPSGDMRDRALLAAAAYWSGQDDRPFTNIALQAIADPAKRHAATFQMFQQLSRRDKAAADRWLVEQGIAPEVRQSWKTITGPE